MKSIQLYSFTSAGTFLFSQGNQCKEGTFEGLHFDNSMLTRHIVKSIMNKPLDCKFGKSAGKIRYANFEFYEEMLKMNAAKINQLEFEESKIFSQEEKDKLVQASTNINTEKLAELAKMIVDYSADRRKMPALFSRVKKVSAKIQYLHDQFGVSFQEEGLTHYLPLRLRNIDHYFQLVQRQNFLKFLQQNKQVDVNFVSCKFNLVKNQYEIEAILPQSVDKAILLEGWGTVALKNLNYIQPTYFAQLRKYEQQAKISHKGIFAKPFQILSLVYTKNNLVAVVEEIIEGYIFKIRAKNDEVIKVQLAKIYCPLGNDAGAFACRQFARKNLIGREVNVFLTKDEGLNILGSLVRFSDNKDIQSLMIQNGYGFVKDQLKGTMFYAKLETLQKKAKDLRKGIHNQKSVGYQFYQDFTTPHTKKQKLDKKNSIESKRNYLRHSLAGDEGVIDKSIDAITYVVRIDSHKKIIKVKLDGVAKLVANPRLPQMIQLQKTTDIYCYKNFHQRTVSLELTEYNEAINCFIGVIRHTTKGKEKISFQQTLLSQGLVILSNNGFLEQKWVQAQKQAEAKQIGVWNERLKNFIRKDIFEEQPKQFVGKFSWVENGETAYIQPQSAADRLEMVRELLENRKQLWPVKQEDLISGYLCAAEYQEQLYRARIISIEKGNALVKFVDWGNKETVPVTVLRQIPQKLQYLPPLCCEVELDLVKALKTKDPEHLERMRQFLMQSDVKVIKSYSNIVNIYMGKIHLNAALIYEGYVKADLIKIPDENAKKNMITEMEKLRKDLVGVWDLEDPESDGQEEKYMTQ